MKNFWKRALALALAALMLIGICGCKGGKGGDDDKTTFEPLDEEEAKIIESLGENGLNGYEFIVTDFNDGRWNRDNSGTAYADAWVQLLDEVEYLYNCKITPTFLSVSDMFTIIQPEIAAGEKYADLVCTTQWQYGNFLGAGVMMDLNELDVNWDNKWWNQRIREMATFGGKTYVGGGSFIFDTAQTWVLYYNEAIWKANGFEDPYKLVDEHRWTQDKFAEYCRTAAHDEDGTGALDSYDDVYGVIAANGDFVRAWYMGLGGRFFENDPETGHVKLACNNQHTYDLIEKMYNMVKRDKSISLMSYNNETEKIADFLRGRTLFYAYMPGVGGLQDMEDDWGVIPLPLYDENQEEYLSGVDHNSTVFGVTNTNTNKKEVSIILEALGRHAMILENIFWPDFKETYWRHEEDDTRMMSQYVVGHGQHDLALVMQNSGNAFRAPMDRMGNTVFGAAGPDFASYIEAAEDAILTQIADYFQY